MSKPDTPSPPLQPNPPSEDLAPGSSRDAMLMLAWEMRSKRQGDILRAARAKGRAAQAARAQVKPKRKRRGRSVEDRDMLAKERGKAMMDAFNKNPAIQQGELAKAAHVSRQYVSKADSPLRGVYDYIVKQQEIAKAERERAAPRDKRARRGITKLDL